MKKTLRFIGKTLIFILYCMFTGKERQMYQHAKLKDREVLSVSNDAFGSTFIMGKKLFGEEPNRNYLRWKEYRELHNF